MGGSEKALERNNDTKGIVKGSILPRLSPSVFIALKADSPTDEDLSKKMQNEETSL